VIDSREQAEHALRDAGLRVTSGRLALLAALEERPHSDAETLHGMLVAQAVPTSIQSVHNMLAALAASGLLRRIERAGSSARFDLRASDNHHHLICTSCGDMVDVDCVSGSAPCLHPADAAGFTIEAADVTFWGLCASCQTSTLSA
jgi:Fur family transcriptional regulator, stress-responsive regulator